MSPIRWIGRLFAVLSPGQSLAGHHGGSSTAGGRAPASASKSASVANSRTPGFRHANLLGTVVAAVTGAVGAWSLWGWIQLSPRYAFTVGVPTPDWIVGVEPDFWCHVFAASLTASPISLVQLVVIWLLVVSALRLGLTVVGDTGAAKPLRLFPRTARYARFCIVTLPALGMLSTCVGLLASGQVPRDVVKIIIFGPSAIGVTGLLLASAIELVAGLGRQP